MKHKLKIKTMKHIIALFSISAILISCDKDFNNVGTNLVSENHFEVNVNDQATVATENYKINGVHPLQTDNLPYSVLGYYNDPIYGSTTANVVSQVALSKYGTDFGAHPVITKVIFSMPYYSRKISVNADGEGTYELDSVYGAPAPIKLSLYKSDYFLNDFDPNTNFEERQKYYSDSDAFFAPYSFGNPANLIFEEPNLKVLADEVEVNYVDDNGGDQTERLSPRYRKELLDGSNTNPTTAFDWLIDPNNATALSSASEFKNFYRGIYFKTEAVNSNGTFFGLDLSQANIEVFYGKLLFEADGTTPLDADNDGNQDIEEVSSVKILFKGNRVNTFTNNITYTEDADKLYLKGGVGALVRLDLFNPVSDDDRTSVELTDIRNQAENWLINEANLEFYVADDVAAANAVEPERIFLYDIKNNKVLADYLLDVASSNPLYSKVNHLGRLERDASGNGVKYKINITEHIKNVVKKDSTNVKLGLVVSNNVSLLGTSDVKDEDNPDSVLTSSIVSHQGTVLYNENATAPKKLKLKIYYTEIN